MRHYHNYRIKDERAIYGYFKCAAWGSSVVIQGVHALASALNHNVPNETFLINASNAWIR